MAKYLVSFLLCFMEIHRAIPFLTSQLPAPKMVIFDLDYTLWPFQVDINVQAPFRKNGSGDLLDCRGNHVPIYPDTIKVLKYLRANKIRLAIASGTPEVIAAKQLVTLFGWNKLIANKQIGISIPRELQIRKISNILKIKLDDMLYFGAKHWDVVNVEKFGVVSVLLENGITVKDLMHGFFKYSDSHTGINGPKVYRQH